ncbi:unnamed protein product [Prunus brigantina]
MGVSDLGLQLSLCMFNLIADSIQEASLLNDEVCKPFDDKVDCSAKQGTSSRPRFFHYVRVKALCEQPNDVEWVKMKIEAMIRNSYGRLCSVVAMHAPSQISVLATEFYVLKIGISFAVDASFSPLLVESDSLSVIQLLLKEEACYAAK